MSNELRSVIWMTQERLEWLAKLFNLELNSESPLHINSVPIIVVDRFTGPVDAHPAPHDHPHPHSHSHPHVHPHPRRGPQWQDESA